MLLEVEQDCSAFKYCEVVVTMINKNWDATVWVHLHKPRRLIGYSDTTRYSNPSREMGFYFLLPTSNINAFEANNRDSGFLLHERESCSLVIDGRIGEFKFFEIY